MKKDKIISTKKLYFKKSQTIARIFAYIEGVYKENNIVNNKSD